MDIRLHLWWRSQYILWSLFVSEVRTMMIWSESKWGRESANEEQIPLKHESHQNHVSASCQTRLTSPNDLSIIPHLFSDLSDSVTPRVGEKPELSVCQLNWGGLLDEEWNVAHYVDTPGPGWLMDDRMKIILFMGCEEDTSRFWPLCVRFPNLALLYFMLHKCTAELLDTC